jgi:hypothetical protein
MRRAIAKAQTAQYRPALGGPERDRSLDAALSAVDLAFNTWLLESTAALRPALLAAPGVVVEIFFAVVDLLAGGESEFGAAFNAG